MKTFSPFLLKKNLELADKEAKGEAITPPGLPAFVKEPKIFISADYVSVDKPKAQDLSTAESSAAAAKFYSIYEEPTPDGKNRISPSHPGSKEKAAFVSESRFAFVSIHSIAASSSSKEKVAKLVTEPLKRPRPNGSRPRRDSIRSLLR